MIDSESVLIINTLKNIDFYQKVALKILTINYKGKKIIEEQKLGNLIKLIKIDTLL